MVLYTQLTRHTLAMKASQEWESVVDAISGQSMKRLVSFHTLALDTGIEYAAPHASRVVELQRGELALFCFSLQKTICGCSAVVVKPVPGRRAVASCGN